MFQTCTNLVPSRLPQSSILMSESSGKLSVKHYVTNVVSDDAAKLKDRR